MLISSDDDETSLHEVQKHNISDSTLTSCSTLKTDEEMTRTSQTLQDVSIFIKFSPLMANISILTGDCKYICSY